MHDDDTRPDPDGRPRVVYRERLHVPAWWWVALAALVVASVAIAVTADAQWWFWVLLAIAVPLTVWSFVSAGRDTIEVTANGQGGGELRVSSARLPFDAISRSAVVPPSAKFAAMGRQLDPEAYVVQHGFVPAMVIVVLDDPTDPTPYWLVSSRDPEGLAAALPDNRLR